MNKEICYKCERKATSREHVPPICLFPEMKDTIGINFRKDLITVPSCDLHNSKKSDDDEFLLLSLSGLMKNNPIIKKVVIVHVEYLQNIATTAFNRGEQ